MCREQALENYYLIKEARATKTTYKWTGTGYNIPGTYDPPIQSPRVGGGGGGGRGRIGMLGTGIATAGAVGLLGAVLHTRESNRRARLNKRKRRG